MKLCHIKFVFVCAFGCSLLFGIESRTYSTTLNFEDIPFKQKFKVRSSGIY